MGCCQASPAAGAGTALDSTASQAQQLCAKVHDLCAALPPVEFRCLTEMPAPGKDGKPGKGQPFQSLVPVDADALREAVRPIHDCLAHAYALDAEATLHALADSADAYAAGLRPAAAGLRGESRLDKPPVSLDGGGAAGAAIAALGESTAVSAPFAAVRQADPFCRDSAKHRGHRDTRSALLVYHNGVPGAGRRSRNWVTLNLACEPLCALGLRPRDGWYFHMSLAVLQLPRQSDSSSSSSNRQGPKSQSQSQNKATTDV